MASAAYDELGTIHRARLHARAARALQKQDDEPSPIVVVQLARHCELGGLVADAQRSALTAGDHALEEQAPNEAASWYRKALDHATALGRPDPERADLLVSLGEAQHRSGDPQALSTLSEGAKLAEQGGARAALVRAALASDRGFIRVAGYAPEQLKMVGAAVDVADPADEATYARLLALFAQCLVHTSRAELVAEPRMKWIVAIIETFQATMAARFDDAERAATEMFELGNQIGESDVFSVFAAQIFVVATFAGRHADLLSLVEQSASANPDLLVFRLAFGIICTSVGRHDEARPILAEGVAQGFRHVPPDLWWMTTVISYAIIAIEVEDASAAAFLLPLIEPSATEVSFNGATSQGPISAYVGKLHSLLGHHEHADTHLRAALATATSFGWPITAPQH